MYKWTKKLTAYRGRGGGGEGTFGLEFRPPWSSLYLTFCWVVTAAAAACVRCLAMIRPAAVHVRPAVHFRQPPRTAALQAYRTGEKIKEKAFSSEFTLLHLQQQKTYKPDKYDCFCFFAFVGCVFCKSLFRGLYIWHRNHIFPLSAKKNWRCSFICIPFQLA